MRILQVSIFLLLLLLFINFSLDYSRYQPMFFTMGEEFKEIESEEKVFLFSNLDTLLKHRVFLLRNADNLPLLYYAQINTPVCIDNICKPVNIQIYWNLTGDYVGYGILKRFPLTKYDHEKFNREDYHKLHQLLMDKHSILERKQLSDLFDYVPVKTQERIKYQGVELDAKSGATKKEIKNTVVEGALYSCYSIWHLTHGEIVEKIKNYTQSIYAPSLEAYLLNSNYSDYHLYALKQMKKEDFEKQPTQILKIFKSAAPLTRTYLLKKIPEQFWKKPDLSRELYSNFSNIDIQSKTLLIKKLSIAHSENLEILSNQIDQMSANQLKKYLKFLQANSNYFNAAIKRNFEKIIQSKTYTHLYLMEEFLSDMLMNEE